MANVLRKLAVTVLLAGAQLTGWCDPEQDTVGPDTFWFLQPEVTVAKDSTNATVWADFSPGSRSWSGNVGFHTADGTATAPADYDSVSGGLAFGWIQSPLPIQIPIHGNSSGAGDKSFKVELSNPSGYPTGIISGANPVIVRMMENTNGIVSFATTRQYVLAAEGTAQIRVVRTGSADGTITVDYQTGAPRNIYKGVYHGYLGSTAWPGDDYVVTNGTLTFGPGVTEQFFTVQVMDRQQAEPPLLKVYLSEEFGPDFHLSAKILDLVIVPTPRLSMEPSGNQLKVSWRNDGMPFVLEGALDLRFQQPEIVPHTTNAQECIALETITGPNRFYRLRQ